MAAEESVLMPGRIFAQIDIIGETKVQKISLAGPFRKNGRGPEYEEKPTVENQLVGIAGLTPYMRPE